MPAAPAHPITQPDVPPAAKPRFTWRPRPRAVMACAMVAVFLGLLGYLRRLEHAAADPAGAPAAGETPPLLTADRIVAIRDAVRSLKVVTVEIMTSVTSSSSDDSIWGGVNASVTAPVRLLYGTDLQNLSDKAVVFSPVHKLYSVKVPPPARISTEVLGQFEDAKVITGWMRSRKTAGEYHLGVARRDLHLRTQALTLDGEQMERVRRTTREQVEALVRKIAGGEATVTVQFEDEGAGS